MSTNEINGPRCCIDECQNTRDPLSKHGLYCKPCWECIVVEATDAKAEVIANAELTPAAEAAATTIKAPEPIPLKTPAAFDHAAARAEQHKIAIAAMGIPPEMLGGGATSAQQAQRQTVPEAPKAEIAKAEPKLSDTGMVLSTTAREAWAYARTMHESGMLPRSYDSIGKVFAGMQYAAELGLKPMTALRQIASVHGTPSIWGELPLAICMTSGDFEWLDEWWETKDGVRLSVADKTMHLEAFAAFCVIKRKLLVKPVETYYDQDLARKAQLLPGKPESAWAKHTRRMLRMRARGECVKNAYPERLAGIGIGEYDLHTIDAEVIDDQTPSNAQRMQDRLKNVGGNTIDAEKTP